MTRLILHEEFFGISVDVYRHESNPAEDPHEHGHMYHAGYWEIVATTTPENLSVPTQTQKILLVTPKEDWLHDTWIDDEITVFPIGLTEGVTGLAFNSGRITIENNEYDADFLVINLDTEGPNQKSLVLIFEHTKDEFHILNEMLLD